MTDAQFKTVADLFDALGVAKIRNTGGFTSQQMSNWKSDGVIPANRFDFFDDLCRASEIPTPRHLFGFIPPASTSPKNVAAE